MTVVAIVACLLLLIVAEVAVRVRATMLYGSTATAEDLFVIDEALRLRVPKANLVSGRIATNSLGFRSPEIPTQKPPGTLRLAFLGASTTWCAEVSSNEHTWPHLVVERLRQRWPQRPIDFVNAGVVGYSVRSIQTRFDARVAPLDPDVVVIYEATNDLTGELREIAARQGIMESARFEPPSWPARYSLLWELAEKNLRVLLAQRASATATGRIEIDASQLGESFRRDLRSLVASAKARGAKVVLVTFSTHLRAGQGPEQQRAAMTSASYYMPFATHDVLLRAYARYNEIIREVAAEAGVALVDQPETIPGDPGHFVDSVHFTDQGSAAMANRVATALEALELDAIGQ